MPARRAGGDSRPFSDGRLIRQLAFWFGNHGGADPELVPEKDPNAGKKLYACPWPKALTIVNQKRVADFWCGGDGEKAKKLPRSTFNEVLAVAIAQEQGKAIEAENDAREAKRQQALADLRKGS